MYSSNDHKKWITAAVRLGVLTIGVSLVGFVCVVRVGAQETQTLTRTITITSDPPGATVWKKEGTTLTCLDIITPGTVELKFHGAGDLQKIRLRKFGYKGRNLDVKPPDDKVNAALGDPAPDSFLVTDDAKPELKQLNDGLSEEFQKKIFADSEAFRCVPFELGFVQVVDDGGELTLGVVVVLDRSFGGSAFRLASHAVGRDERTQKMAQLTLENGIADLLARIHRIAAKFPKLKVITVSCLYPTTEAYVVTIDTPLITRAYTVEEVLKPGGGYGPGLVWHTGTGTREDTEVKDRDVERVIKFVVTAAQIPDTLDKKAITDAVLAVGKIGLAESRDSSSKPPSSPR